MDKDILSILKQAIKEDMGKGDVTTFLIIPQDKIIQAEIIFKQPGVICGLSLVKELFRFLDKDIKFKSKYKDGEKVKSGAKVAYIEGKARVILIAERVALNFISHLSGIATMTREFVEQACSSRVKIIDTRKTIPNLRQLQKYAVKCGGGYNHRFNLNEMVMIKDNHKVAMAGQKSLVDLIRQAKRKTKKIIEVEVENLKEYRQALLGNPNIIMLDNMKLSDIKKAVKIKSKNRRFSKIKLEVSGNVGLENIRKIAKAGVDMISVGSLTHSVRAIDVSLEIK
ncbi:MAG: carboxylating nicotinate-nucleotide diphosphorylase [Candidatus Omnitrophota bacterium]|nr:carboxylating nicotinate-nucleotide diphosphorylase [Candidatus Omnitrophota bacterium]